MSENNELKRSQLEEYARLLAENDKELFQVRNRTQAELFLSLRDIALFDIGDVFDADSVGNISLRNLQDMPAHARRSIKKIKVRQDKNAIKQIFDAEGDEPVINSEMLEIEFHDKLKALDMLAKHSGFYETDNKQKVSAAEDTIGSLLTLIADKPINNFGDDDE